MLNNCADKKCREARLGQLFGAWKQHTAEQSYRKKIGVIADKSMTTRKLRRVFESWRGVSHKEFMQRVDNESPAFRRDLEDRMLKQWTKKVDEQLLYMAQLEDRIKAEVEAREALAASYERSMNTGVTQMNHETADLQQSPLVEQISLIVAQQLLKKGQTNEHLNTLIRQGSRDQTLLDTIFKQ